MSTRKPFRVTYPNAEKRQALRFESNSEAIAQALYDSAEVVAEVYDDRPEEPLLLARYDQHPDRVG